MQLQKNAPEQLLRFLWVPKAGDRVFLLGKKTRVDFVLDGLVFVSAFPGKGFKSMELKFRPTPQDYDAVLTELSHLFTYRELHTGVATGHQMVGIGVPSPWSTHLPHTLILQGRPRKILAGILELRAGYLKLNQAINQLVASRQPSGGIHFDAPKSLTD